MLCQAVAGGERRMRWRRQFCEPGGADGTVWAAHMWAWGCCDLVCGCGWCTWMGKGGGDWVPRACRVVRPGMSVARR